MILEDIIARKKQELINYPELSSAPKCQRDFMQIFKADHLTLIAEIKPKSPAHGALCDVEHFNPITRAKSYLAGGADAISVLTDHDFFGGGMEYLEQVFQSVDLPVLCKDFIIDVKQIRRARIVGADACLLMPAIVEADTLLTLKTEIEALAMTAVFEVYNEAELQAALSADPKVILLNNRNLNDFSVDFDKTARLIKLVPEDVKVISASGYLAPNQVQSLPAGVSGVLMGSALMTADDATAFLQACRQ